MQHVENNNIESLYKPSFSKMNIKLDLKNFLI